MLLNKYIAHAGVASRRKAVELIKAGQVKINGVVVKEPAYDVKPTDQVTVAGKSLHEEKKIYILLNKPKNYVATVSDERNRKTVLDLIGPTITQRIYPVGRLDRDTTGLLLLTNDGMLANRLSHPRYQVSKVYHVVLNRPCSKADLEQLCEGVSLSDGTVYADEVSFIPQKSRNHVHLTLHSGKNRVVRRLFEALGYEVIKLDRIAYAHLTKKGLPVGHWRFLTEHDIALFNQAPVEKNKKGLV